MIGVAAAGTGTFVHEALGHGGACLALGGAVARVSADGCVCVGLGSLSPAAGMLWTSSGTLANLLLGAGALAARGRFSAPLLRFALGAFGAYQLAGAAVYLALDPLLRLGDWGLFLGYVRPDVRAVAAALLAFFGSGIALLAARPIERTDPGLVFLLGAAAVLGFLLFSGAGADSFRAAALFHLGGAGYASCVAAVGARGK